MTATGMATAARPRAGRRIGQTAALGAALMLAMAVGGCETGSGGPGVGTVGGAALGAGAGRAIFGGSTSAMLIGGAVGGMAGNMTVDRQNEERQIQRREAQLDRSAQRQLDFERQRALQQADVERQIEEQRQFDAWRRSQGMN